MQVDKTNFGKLLLNI